MSKKNTTFHTTHFFTVNNESTYHSLNGVKDEGNLGKFDVPSSRIIQQVGVRHTQLGTICGGVFIYSFS